MNRLESVFIPATAPRYSPRSAGPVVACRKQCGQRHLTGPGIERQRGVKRIVLQAAQAGAAASCGAATHKLA